MIFGLKAFRHWVSCEHNSSYSFSWISLKLCRCFCQGLTMCMMFGCNPQINFLLLFSQFYNLVIFGLKAFRHWVSCEHNSLYSCSWISLKLCRCFCQSLKMCMMFDCNAQINFCHFCPYSAYQYLSLFCSSDLIIFGLKAFRH